MANQNTIIINGLSSKTINGLLIQELPAIVKPPIRTEVEQIDGRDGDIITKLGFGAYDREARIGLYGDYNINNVIQFFSTGGEVIFSNEPDMVYECAVLEQIDFERLARFKTGTVVFHTQPFKFSTNEGSRNYTITNNTSINIYNNGNTESRPTLSIVGTGEVSISLNGYQIFNIDFGSSSNQITIDTTQCEAYYGSGTLANRAVDGDYDFFRLQQGSNTIDWTGTISSITISRYSRWI